MAAPYRRVCDATVKTCWAHLLEHELPQPRDLLAIFRVARHVVLPKERLWRDEQTLSAMPTPRQDPPTVHGWHWELKDVSKAQWSALTRSVPAVAYR